MQRFVSSMSFVVFLHLNTHGSSALQVISTRDVREEDFSCPAGPIPWLPLLPPRLPRWTSFLNSFASTPYKSCTQIRTHLPWGWGCHRNLYHAHISTYLSAEGARKSWFHMINTFLTECTWSNLNDNLRISHLWFIGYGMCFLCEITISEHPQQRDICWCVI